MSIADLTDLQREILVTAYRNPRASQSEIAKRCDCSASYVSNVLNRYDEFDALQADVAEFETSLSQPSFSGDPVWMDGPSAGSESEIDLENTPVDPRDIDSMEELLNYVIALIILVVLVYAGYRVVLTML